jgi:DNA polymerase-3 subunit alpha
MVEAEREVDPETGKKLPAAVNKTVVMVLAKCGAFDAFGDRKAAIAKLEEYFGTTSVKKRAAVNFDALPALRRPLPQDYLDWEQELLGAYLTSHPAEGLPAEIWEQATDTVNDLLVFGTKADDDEDGRDRKETRTVVGVITKAEIRVTRAKGIEFLSGTIADDTGSGKWQWWAPRPGREAPEIHRAYAAMKAAIEAATIKGEGAILRGAFEASKDYGNSMGLIDYTLVPLPRLAPEVPEAEAALARPADTTVLEPSPEQVSAGLDELFG